MIARKKFRLENVHLRRQRPVKQIENGGDYLGINYHCSATHIYKKNALGFVVFTYFMLINHLYLPSLCLTFGIGLKERHSDSNKALTFKH